LARIASNGVRTLIVEAASRFAHDLIVQETGYRFLRDAGITLIRGRQKKRETGSAGTQEYPERAPDAVALAKKLRRYPINGHKRSLRDIAAELETQAMLTGGMTLRPS